MLKKTIILGATLAVVSLPSWASGFYAGAGVGRDSVNFNTATTNIWTFTPEVVSRATSDDGASGFLGSLFAGYRWDITDKFSLAGELNVEGSTAEHTDRGSASDGVVFAKDKYSLDRGVGLSILPGFKIASKTRLYGRLGYVRSNLNIDTLIPDADTSIDRANNYTSYSASKALNGVRYGLGIETEVTHNVGLRLDYSRTNYQSYSFSKTSNSALYSNLAKTTSLRVTPNSDQIELGVDYYFG